jgi:hypothetical protein
MLNRNFILGALLALSVSFLVAFSNAKSESNAVYEYVTISQFEGTLFIEEQGKETTRETLKKESRTLNGAYSAINKYEVQGYELFETGIDASKNNLNWYLLRRKKQ